MSNPFYVRKQELQQRIRTIPKSNKYKFYCDVLYLIDLAHEEDYDKIEITKD